MTPSECIGDAQRSETPYKHVVRHAVTICTPYPDSHLGVVRSVSRRRRKSYQPFFPLNLNPESQLDIQTDYLHSILH